MILNLMQFAHLLKYLLIMNGLDFAKMGLILFIDIVWQDATMLSIHLRLLFGKNLLMKFIFGLMLVDSSGHWLLCIIILMIILKHFEHLLILMHLMLINWKLNKYNLNNGLN